MEALNNVGEAVRARQKSAKKRSLLVVNEHFEPVFNVALTTQVIIQRFPKSKTQHTPIFITGCKGSPAFLHLICHLLFLAVCAILLDVLSSSLHLKRSANKHWPCHHFPLHGA